MLLYYSFLFLFFHVTLLLPGLAFIRISSLFRNNSGLELSFAYILGLAWFGLLAILGYVLKINPHLLQIAVWAYVLAGIILFVKERLYKDIWAHFRFPLICLVLMSFFSLVYIGLSFPSAYTYIPDPEPLSGRNYDTLNVKVLNVSGTPANDNYVPYRQAQFIVNRSDPGKDCFICEWGVGFFQRTPLMGAVTASYFYLLDDRPPVDYLWSSTAQDPSHTYLKFQILAQILNALFIIPTFYLLTLLFNKKVAAISATLLVTSPFFLYNAVFSWPKSLVAFFVLVMWLLLYAKRLRYTVLAGVVGGLAYLTHDLAAFYIAASVLFLLYHRRFKDTFILGGISGLIALPWIFTSSVLYKKPSTFVLYPFSLHGLPQGSRKEILSEFFRTPVREIVSIRFDTLFYLLSPYDLIYKTAEQDLLRRTWATGIFSIPGSLGFGLVIPAILGIFKRIKKLDFWILVIVPILLAALIVGWRGSRAIASLHFAQAIIVLLTGLGIAFLLRLRTRLWLFLAIALNLSQLVVLVYYSYPESSWRWAAQASNAVALLIMICISATPFMLASMKKLPAWIR